MPRSSSYPDSHPPSRPAQEIPPGIVDHDGEAGLVWTGLGALALGHFAVDCCTGIWPVYKTIAHLDVTKAGLIATAGSVVANGFQGFFGPIADRGKRKMFLIGGALLAGSVAMVPYTQSYAVMSILVLATCLGSAAFHPSGTGSASSMSRQRKGLFVAVFLVGGYLGYSISQLLFSALFRMSNGTGLLVAIPWGAAAALALVVRNDERSPSTNQNSGLSRLRLKPIIPLFVIQVFAGAINLALVFLLPDLLLSRHAPYWAVQGGAHCLLVLGGALSLLPAGYISDKFGARKILIIANTVTGILLILLLMHGLDIKLMLALVAAFGAFNGINTVVSVSEGNRLMPGKASFASALLMGIPWCISAISPVVVGLLSDPNRGGSPTRALAWMTLCIPAILGACMLVKSSRPGR